MEDGKSSRTGGNGYDKLKICCSHFVKNKDIENQELYEYVIRDNIKCMLIVSIIMILILVVKIIVRINNRFFANVGIIMLFIMFIYILLWYFIHNKMIENLHIQKIIYQTFWILMSACVLKELYREMQVNHTVMNFYLFMYLITGFYIGSLIESVCLVGINSIIALVMLVNMPKADMDIKFFSVVILSLASISMVTLTMKYYNYIVDKKAQYTIRALGGVDQLTNLLNRRGFEEKLDQLWTQWSDIQKSIVTIMIDIDYFKNYNDTFGHIAGDQCLKDITECIYDIASRKTDFIVRYGGEEIVIVLTEQNEEDCIDIALKIQERIHGLQIKAGEKATYEYITVSMGIASMIVSPSNTIYDVIEKADEQLYYSKNSGRNRITMNNISVEFKRVKSINKNVLD